jgi:hypothetical protein
LAIPSFHFSVFRVFRGAKSPGISGCKNGLQNPRPLTIIIYHNLNAMKKRLATLGWICMSATLLTICGCGDHGRDLSMPAVPKDTKAFDSASPEMKAEWSTILAAVETNGYAVAILTGRKLKTAEGLTDEQRKAVDDTTTVMLNRMREAADKGDANAIDDAQEIAPRRR